MADTKILHSSDRGDLEESVNDHLSEGWIPSGSLTVLEIEQPGGITQYCTYIQPMVKTD